MIGSLRGILKLKNPPVLLIEIGGLGYEVLVSMSTFYQLPALGKEITLITHFLVREDAQILYGFYDERERALFRSLIKTTGVGPKMALTILSGMDVNTFIRCVETKDVALLVRLPGVGQKTAERLLVEMAGKLKGIATDIGEFSHKLLEGAETSPLNNSIQEATAALVALGYKPQEAQKAISKVNKDNLETSEIIRSALQGLAKV